MAKFRVKEGESVTFGTTASDQRRYEAGELIEMTPEQGAKCDAVEAMKKEAAPKA
jgi:hypothetical protein